MTLWFNQTGQQLVSEQLTLTLSRVLHKKGSKDETLRITLHEREIKILIEALELLANHSQSYVKNNEILEPLLNTDPIFNIKSSAVRYLKDEIYYFVNLPEPEYCDCGNELTYMGGDVFHASACDQCLGIEPQKPFVKLSEYYEYNKCEIDWSFTDYNCTLQNIRCAKCGTNLLTYGYEKTLYCPKCE